MEEYARWTMESRYYAIVLTKHMEWLNRLYQDTTDDSGRIGTIQMIIQRYQSTYFARHTA